jgi:aryl-alcohol dehydrogenase-like predicted oxidoreductase
MKTTTLNGTAETISAIGFGGMPLSIQGRPPEDAGRLVLHAAIDAGMTLIDTADVYCLDDRDIGHNERLIASVLKERPDRDRIKVATKAGLRRPNGAWTNDGSPTHIREACEKSLRALESEQLWLYQFHAPDPNVPFETSVEAFAELQRAGKFKWFGLSNVSVDEIERARRILPVVSVQNRLNPFFREALSRGVVRHCDANGITFLAYSPLGGGRLTKKIPSIDVLLELARKHDASPHAIVVAWVRSKGKSVVPIPAASKPANAIDSAKAADITLDEGDIRAIDEAEFSRA